MCMLCLYFTVMWYDNYMSEWNQALLILNHKQNWSILLCRFKMEKYFVLEKSNYVVFLNIYTRWLILNIKFLLP